MSVHAGGSTGSGQAAAPNTSSSSSTSRLRYKVVHSSSEDPDYRVNELMYHSSKTKGWQSARFCDYPQEIGLVFEGVVNTKQIQFLSHQSKIASKIELFVDCLESQDVSVGGLPSASVAETKEAVDNLLEKLYSAGGGSDIAGVTDSNDESSLVTSKLKHLYDTKIPFKRLGYLSLDSNERSQFQARELKSVYIDHKSRFLKIRLHKCHLNKHNLVNQVGLIAVNVLGEPLPRTAASSGGPSTQHLQLVERSAPPSLTAALETPASSSITATAPAPAASSSRAPAAAAARMDVSEFDPKTAEKIRALELAKQHAVDIEDYGEAKRYKDMIDQLQRNSRRIKELERAKKQAVEKEDYDLAKHLKQEIDMLYKSAYIEDGGAGGTGYSNMGGGAPPARSPPFGNKSFMKSNYGNNNASMGSNHDDMYSAHQVNSAPPPPFIDSAYSTDDHNNSYGSDDGGGGGGLYGAVASSPLGQPHSKKNSTRNNATGSSTIGGGVKLPANNEDFAIPSRGAYNMNDMEYPPDSEGPTNGTYKESYGHGSAAPSRNSNLDQLGPDSDPNMMQGLTHDMFKNNGDGFGDDAGSQSAGESAVEVDPGHPLYGVPNAGSLPKPEVNIHSSDKEAQGLVTIFGDYIVSCLYSKQRTLREAALTKINYDLSDGTAFDDLLSLKENPSRGNCNIKDLLAAISTVIKRTISDKMTNVFLLSMQLAQALCTKVILAGEDKYSDTATAEDKFSSFYLKKTDTQPLLDLYLKLLVEKLGDANSRCSQAAGDVVLSFALCPNIGCNFIAQYLLRPLKKSAKVYPSRVYCNRIKLLIILTQEIGIGNGNTSTMGAGGNAPHGIALEPLMALVMSWFNNPNHEVRQSIVELVGVVYSKIGLHAIESFLSNLRPAQREVFDVEFERLAGDDYLMEKEDLRQGGGGPPAHSYGAAGGGSSASSDADEATAEETNEVDAHDTDHPTKATECQFCKQQSDSFTPEGLDLHYWKSCPMLTECAYCQQVIEISSLRSHYVDECDEFPISEIYQVPDNGSAPKLPPAGCCPLCFTEIGDNETDWMCHLINEGCNKNPRKFGASA